MLFHSEVLTGASGSIGGVTYSHNRSGLYRRARAIPVNPNTANQQNVRNAFTTLVTRWTETLTPDQRNGWDLYGLNVPVLNPLGSPITISGQNWYIACNTPRVQSNFLTGTDLAIIDTAPIIFDRGSLTPPTALDIASSNEITFTFTNTNGWATAVGGALLVFQGKPTNATVNFFDGPYRLVGIVRGAVVPPTSPVTIDLSLLAAGQFYDVTGMDNNNKVSIKFLATFPDGRLTTPQTQRILVTP